MKKNLIIVILAIISIASLIFGYTQNQKAEEQEALAKELSKTTNELRQQAETEQRKSREVQEMARQQVEQMRVELELAKKKNNSTD